MFTNDLIKRNVGVIVVLVMLVIPFHKSTGQTTGKFSLPLWISDYMIFPSETNWTLQGSCGAFQEVSASFGEMKISTRANKDGIWEINFPPTLPGTSGDMVFVCNCETKIIKNALSGNIWLCAGQSNMAMQVKSSCESAEAVNDLSLCDVRYFNGKQWIKVTNENVQNISAVAFFFAVEMEKIHKNPAGIFLTARGGTGIEAWLPRNAFPDNETGNRYSTLVNDPQVLKAASEDKNDMKPYGQHRLAKWGLGRAVPASLFHELIFPFGQLPITGVIWYQGESNTGNIKQATEYRFWLENLIFSYRKHFNNPDLPFAVVQLPTYDPGEPESREAWRILQDVQETVANHTAHTVIVDIKDLGENDNIHPCRKKEVGVRTAKAVCKLIYDN